ncbi:MAG: site-specific DNA-methyltransferase [Methylococcales bacterium]|nr:site-specific DNA-methyltransferase [Methylococcales bacterium]
MDKLKLHTPNLTDENTAKIAALFPHCVTEGKIDFELLKQELSSSMIDGTQERYQLNWVGKREALLNANAPIAKTLRPCRDESVDFDTTENLYIEGDNLDALKLLQETYLNKVKMIYIDPPYNTGNDFIYEDDFAENTADYLQRSNQKDEAGNRLTTNSESNGRFHSDWLSMMYPRLKLARNLLRDDGVIFISIDDNEQANLKRLCDEVFGEDNFAGCFLWLLPRGINAGLIARAHEYVLCYTKDSLGISYFNRLNSEIEYSVERCNKKIDERHPASSITFPAGIKYEGIDRILSGAIEGSERIEIDGNLIFSNGFLAHPVTLTAGWTMKNMILSWLAGNEVVDTKGQKIVDFFFKENGKLYSKKEITTLSIKSVLKDLPDTQKARQEIEELLGSQDIFSYPKTKELLKVLGKLSTNENDIILDFFSGSATTAHAVMQLNAEDGGKRKFIMVQIPEACDEKSEAFKAGYKTIADIGKERIRRAGQKIKQALVVEQSSVVGEALVGEALASTGSTFAIPFQTDIVAAKAAPTTAPTIAAKAAPTNAAPTNATPTAKATPASIDIGFRVLKIDSSNMNDVYYSPDALSKEDLHQFIENIKPDRTDEDLLFQVLLDWGVDLSLPIERKTIDSKTVFVVANDAIVACFDRNGGVTETFIKELAKIKPLRAVFCDAGFASDSVKINVEQIFNMMSPSTDIKTI